MGLTSSIVCIASWNKGDRRSASTIRLRNCDWMGDRPSSSMSGLRGCDGSGVSGGVGSMYTLGDGWRRENTGAVYIGGECWPSWCRWLVTSHICSSGSHINSELGLLLLCVDWGTVSVSCGAEVICRLCCRGSLRSVVASTLLVFFSLCSMHRDWKSVRVLDGLGLQSFFGGRGGRGFKE